MKNTVLKKIIVVMLAILVVSSAIFAFPMGKSEEKTAYADYETTIIDTEVRSPIGKKTTH